MKMKSQYQIWDEKTKKFWITSIILAVIMLIAFIFNMCLWIKLFHGLRNACFELNYKWVDYNLYSYSEWNNLLRKHPELEEFILKEKNFVKS